MSDNDRDKITVRKLRELLVLATNRFTDKEHARIEEYINVDEYGLALDTFVGAVRRGTRKMSSAEYELVRQLAETMKMSEELRVTELQKFIDPSA